MFTAAIDVPVKLEHVGAFVLLNSALHKRAVLFCNILYRSFSSKLFVVGNLCLSSEGDEGVDYFSIDCEDTQVQSQGRTGYISEITIKHQSLPNIERVYPNLTALKDPKLQGSERAWPGAYYMSSNKDDFNNCPVLAELEQQTAAGVWPVNLPADVVAKPIYKAQVSEGESGQAVLAWPVLTGVELTATENQNFKCSISVGPMGYGVCVAFGDVRDLIAW